jgi:hypothetical protein
MIKEIREFLTESIKELDNELELYKGKDEFIKFVNNMNKSITHELAKRKRCNEADISIDNMLNRKATTATNLLIYVTIDGVNTAEKRKSASDDLKNVIFNYASKHDELKDFKHVTKSSYSHTVDVTEVVYKKDNTKVKINYVMKSISTMLRCQQY